MDTNWLEDLRVLSETLNFSRAAERRNITQPAFGRRIRALEHWCGVSLFDRRGHRIALTAAGQMMLEAATDVTRRLERVRNELDQGRAAAATLTFAATHALSFSFFPTWIRSLGAAASGQPMRLLSDNMKQCEDIMLNGRAQFLLCHHHPTSPAGLSPDRFDHVMLARDLLVPVVGTRGGQPLHRLPGGRDAPVPHLSFEKSSGMGRILSRALLDRAGDLYLRPVMSSHLAIALKAMALEGRGVAWIPESLARDELGATGRLALAGSSDWHVDVGIVMFRPRDRMPDKAERFWELARASAAAG
ncbi:LysR substrate-binding domain-containing protein [Paracoccus beibuensis]|uniref:LysR substrate-binding domain-containing protein n=1 Tax=Paracoccus beibuensis TaxID=547602 RepID=UPI00223F1EA5|nr:LysR substrate-binding domain-containing protein [Paracoccus beibuensis]